MALPDPSYLCNTAHSNMYLLTAHTQKNSALEFDIFSLQKLQTSFLADVNIYHLSRSLSPRTFVIVFEWNCPSIDGWIDDLASTEIW